MDNSIIFMEFMTALGEIHNKTLSDITKDIYWKALKPYSDMQCEKAFNLSISTFKFFPKPAELVELIQNEGGSLEDVAVVQAGIVLEKIKRVGGYASIQFDDPVTNAVIQTGFGGWPKLCGELLSDQEKWFLKDFARIYQAYSRQGIKQIEHLPGRIEVENSGMIDAPKNNVVQIGAVFKKMLTGPK